MNDRLDAALKYARRGFSVIPVKKDKKPFLRSWKPYQTKRATEQQIRQWWQRWPEANPAIVTGEISGVDVVEENDLILGQERLLPDPKDMSEISETAKNEKEKNPFIMGRAETK